MTRLSDDLLMDSYQKAKALKLCPKFIQLLETEIHRRSLQPRCTNSCNNKKKTPM
ncbi:MULTISPECIES: sporulation histidine kinase inhibitor Sda [Sporosarcina]|uniref:Sporulation histidine kinase inhibitor Sda n=1 Tax=Sporosarcina saromensis TaxID=359365 RepID=A0ABU4G6A9_9BACL|nr:sporulation histidine kinase inhibitor Sda [Sporosarcina saromensis]MDW0112512.1 sporulation histidine kinase inhibitor Sda [Sporosarcina saromensis]